ncbi:MAG: hypothetical protein F6J87_13570 [Spirulina sp. SIO3F2]|nr:hypothetical protein [Spirulina sp. SIO3F2]
MQEIETTDKDKTIVDPDDTPVEEIKASLKQAWKEAQLGQTIPLSQMWDGIDV